MAANDNSGKMSPDLIRDLSRALSEVDALMKKQEELITTVLDGEKDIAKVRIASLETYFETYSKRLNDIAKQYKDDISDAFSVLDKKLSENAKAATRNKATRSGEVAGSSYQASAADTRGTAQAISEIRELLKRGIDVNDSQQRQLLTNILNTLKNQPASSTTAPSSTPKGSEVKAASTSDEKATAREAYPIINGISEANRIGYMTDNQVGTTNEQGQQPVGPIQTDSVEQAQIAQTKRKTVKRKKIGSDNTESDNTDGIDIDRESLKTVDDFLAEINKHYEAAAKKREIARKQLEAAGLVDTEQLEKASIDNRVTYAYEAQKKLIDEINELKVAAQAKQDSDVVAADTAVINATAEAKARKQMADEQAAYEAKAILAARRKTGRALTTEELANIRKNASEKFKIDEANLEKLSKKQAKEEAKKNRDENRKKIDDVAATPLSKDNNLIDRFKTLKEVNKNKVSDLGGDPKNAKFAKGLAALDTTMTLLSDLAKQLEKQIDKIASSQGEIDTRLQGWSKDHQYKGSYWGQLRRDMMSVGAVTPFFKQEKFAENIKSLVDKGIAFDLKQRAFLMTIQEKIANTFNAADGTLLRLIRIQQEDSTAGRLGMESALNSFLNEMYENTEYLKDVAASVRGSLMEMEALMDGQDATEVEYQVQKWMGSLYSVGMSQEAVNAISSALGQIAAGQIDALTGNGAGNLLVMAASNSGKSIADILESGLDATETNDLLQATVNYLAEIAKNSDSNVVQQQIASVFGVKASDLKAATNLAVSKKEEKSSIGDIYAQQLTYDNMLKQLNNMAGTMYQRTSIAEMMTNVWENGQYSIASSISNSPLAYLTYKLASLLDSAVGGIALPFVNVMGFGVDLNTTVADLIRLGAVGGGLLSNLGPMVSGLASSFKGRSMLSKMGIKEGSALEIVSRGGEGSPANLSGGQQTTSESGYVGNANGSDVKNSTVQEANDSKKQQMIEAKEEEPANQVDDLNTYVIKIYELLDKVASGSQSLRVRVDNYGLTGVNNSSTVVGTSQGGITSLTNDGSSSSTSGGGSIGNAGSNSNGGSSLGGGSSPNYSGAVDLGGWTMF